MLILTDVLAGRALRTSSFDPHCRRKFRVADFALIVRFQGRGSNDDLYFFDCPGVCKWRPISLANWRAIIHADIEGFGSEA
jgi:hypothetical protein